MNEYIPYNNVEQPQALIPRGAVKNPIPDNSIKEQAFYSSAMYSDNPTEGYDVASSELSSNGNSPLVDYAHNSWASEQQAKNEDVLRDIVADPSIPIQHKKNAVMNHVAGVNISTNLRDKFKQQMAIENNDTTQADMNHREHMLDVLYGVRKDIDKETSLVDDARNNVAKSFSGTLLDAMGGIASNFVAGRYGAQTAAVEAMVLGPDDGTTKKSWEFMKSFILPGEANDKMNKIYNGMTPQQKAAFIKDMGDALATTPSFDYNKWEIFRDTVESPDGLHPVFRGIENVAGILDAFALKGFIGATFGSGVLRASKQVLRNWTTLDIPVPKRPTPVERIDPTINRPIEDGAPNPPTGVETPTPAVMRSGRTNTPFTEADYTNLQRLRIAPRSPAGTMAEVNPKKASNVFTQAIVDDSGRIADAMGTNKGEILADTLFPKLDPDIISHPDLYKGIRDMDNYFAESFKQAEFDPFFVPITQREIDKEKIFNSFKETQGATYQQANSTLVEKIDNISGVARYGRNDHYGFTTADEAQKAASVMQRQVPEGTSLNVVERNNQWYIERPYSMDYDPFDAFTFGPNAVSAHFTLPGMEKGIDASGLARSNLASWIWSPSQRLPDWVSKGAARVSRQSGKIDSDFMAVIHSKLDINKQKAELDDALRNVQENQQWQSFKELQIAYPHLKREQVEELYSGYSYYRRLTDYQYYLAERTNRRMLEADKMGGLYDNTGLHIGNATTDIKKANIKEVYDYDLGVSIPTPKDLAGRTLVRLQEPVLHGGRYYEHAVVGNKIKLGNLPENTLPRIQGYVPRQNIENFYVIKTPRSMVVDGESVTGSELNRFTKTIGAGATRKEAEMLMRKLEQEFPDHKLDIKADRSDAATSIITDHAVYKEMLDHSRKRGERLPTLYGKARLENPLEALSRSVQSTVRLDVWKDYDTVFRKNWLRAYGEFTKGEFPNVLTDIKSHKNMSIEDTKQFQSAQRLFEQYTNQKYKATVGDELWKNSLHLIADNIENVVPKWMSQALRDTAAKGNIPIRALKSLSSNLFLYLNPPRQWLVQTQQLLEFSAINKDYMKIAPTVIPSIMMALGSKGTLVGKNGEALYAMAHKMSGMSKGEFDATVKAVYTEGIPQSVDLNLMLHGMLHQAKQDLNPSVAEHASNLLTQFVKFPGNVGKSIGYNQAELANTIGTWLFTQARWKQMNPGKNWNTPENIARISADAWDIGKAMSTRAGMMPYQDGALGLLFQFAAVQHKSFMEIFSSKSFTSAERGRLAAARAALWGVKGVPLGGLIAWMIGEHGDIGTQEEFHKFEGGLTDLVANKMVDVLLSEPGDKASDLSISASMSPMPETLPYVDFLINASKLFDNDPRLPRLPFTGAVGAGMKAAQEIRNIFAVNQLGTEDSLKLAVMEVAKTTSGFNNFRKAMMLQQMDDKIDGFGTKLGLMETRAQAVAQMFGIITKEEEYMYKISDSLKARELFIQERANEINQGLANHIQRFGQPEWHEWVRVQQLLNTFTPPELQREVEQRVDEMQRHSMDTRKESQYTQIMKHIDKENDKWIKQGMGYLMSSTNPKDNEIAQRLIKELGIKYAD